MSHKQTDPAPSPATSSLRPTRRQVLAGGTALAAGAALRPGRTRAQNRVQLKVMSWEQFQPGEKEGFDEIFAKFNDSQSRYEVVWTGWPFNLFIQNVLTQMNAGGIDADLLMAPPDLAAQAVRKFKMAAPVDDVIKDLGVTPTAAHEFLRFEDKLYGVSLLDMRFSLIYNKMLYEKAGLTKAPETPEELVDYTTRLTNRPDQFGWYMPNTMDNAQWWWSTMQNFCLPYDGVWAEGKTPKVTSPEVVKGLQLWKDLYDIGMPQGTGPAAYQGLAGDQRVAQTFDVVAFFTVIRAISQAAFDNAVSAVPPWPNRKALDRLHPLIALNTSPNLEGALEFFKFAAAPENIAALMMKNVYVIPPYDDLAERVPAFKTFLAEMPWAQGVLATVPVSPVDVMGDFAYVDDQFGRIVVQNLQRALVDKSTIEQAMAPAQTQLEALAARL